MYCRAFNCEIPHFDHVHVFELKPRRHHHQKQVTHKYIERGDKQEFIFAGEFWCLCVLFGLCVVVFKKDICVMFGALCGFCRGNFGIASEHADNLCSEI